MLTVQQPSIPWMFDLHPLLAKPCFAVRIVRTQLPSLRISRNPNALWVCKAGGVESDLNDFQFILRDKLLWIRFPESTLRELAEASKISPTGPFVREWAAEQSLLSALILQEGTWDLEAAERVHHMLWAIAWGDQAVRAYLRQLRGELSQALRVHKPTDFSSLARLAGQWLWIMYGIGRVTREYIQRG